MNETTWIYGLYCPVEEKVRYVGASIQPLKRFKAHISASYNERGTMSNASVGKWIRQLRKGDLEPELLLLEEVPFASGYKSPPHPEVVQAEERWILRMLEEEHPIFNVRLPKCLQENTEEDQVNAAVERGKEMFG